MLRIREGWGGYRCGVVFMGPREKVAQGAGPLVLRYRNITKLTKVFNSADIGVWS